MAVDYSLELRDKLAAVACTFGATDLQEPACAPLCCWCKDKADAMIEVFKDYEGIDGQESPENQGKGGC
jgi:hypothetical protein